MNRTCFAVCLATIWLAACEHNAGAQAVAAAAEPADAPPLLPAGWRGTGILADREGTPNAAPVWAKVRAEVVNRNGQRMLRATGRADDVDNPALGRSTAENRARAEIAYWLHRSAVSGAKVVDSWNAGTQVYLALVEVPLAADALGPTN